jgi:hypothetical protein
MMCILVSFDVDRSENIREEKNLGEVSSICFGKKLEISFLLASRMKHGESNDFVSGKMKKKLSRIFTC